jgi:DNA replication licensing factor MCM5
MDRQSVFSTHVYESTFGQNDDTNLQVQAQLEAFILDFRLDNVFVYRYVHGKEKAFFLLSHTNNTSRDQLRENALLKKYYCDVNIGDLIKFNEEIAHRLVNEPADIIPLVRSVTSLRLLALPGEC